MIGPEVKAATCDQLREQGFGHFADDLAQANTSEEITAVVEHIRLGGNHELANFISEEAGFYL